MIFCYFVSKIICYQTFSIVDLFIDISRAFQATHDNEIQSSCCRYQIMVLELLAQSTSERPCLSHNSNSSLKSDITGIHPPNVLDLSQDLEYASQAAMWGIEVSQCYIL